MYISQVSGERLQDHWSSGSSFSVQVRAFTGQSTPTTVFDETIAYRAYMMYTHSTFA